MQCNDDRNGSLGYCRNVVKRPCHIVIGKVPRDSRRSAGTVRPGRRKPAQKTAPTQRGMDPGNARDDPVSGAAEAARKRPTTVSIPGQSPRFAPRANRAGEGEKGESRKGERRSPWDCTPDERCCPLLRSPFYLLLSAASDIMYACRSPLRSWLFTKRPLRSPTPRNR